MTDAVIGDRVEVVITQGTPDEWVLRRGVLVASSVHECFVHCDFLPAHHDVPEWKELGATYRHDQVRKERSPADNMEHLLERILARFEPPKPRWSWQKPVIDPNRDGDIAAMRAVIYDLRRNTPKVVNVAADIITETEDGLRFGSRVTISPPDQRNAGRGFFVAEYRGIRYFTYETGWPYPAGHAYAKEFVTPAK